MAGSKSGRKVSAFATENKNAGNASGSADFWEGKWERGVKQRKH